MPLEIFVMVIICDRHLNARLTTVSLTPNCTQTVSIDNNSCFDLTRVVISTNNGVDLSNPNPLLQVRYV